MILLLLTKTILHAILNLGLADACMRLIAAYSTLEWIRSSMIARKSGHTNNWDVHMLARTRRYSIAAGLSCTAGSNAAPLQPPLTVLF